MSELQAILLAAGGSSRLGRAKQLLSYRGETLVHRAARLLTEVTDAVTVVTGAQDSQISSALGTLPVATVNNPQWRAGVGTSIALAMQSVPPDFRAVLVMLCDQYLLELDDLRALLAAWKEDRSRITAASWSDSFGPPVLFPNRFFPELGRLRGDMGARQLLVGQRARVRFVELPRAATDVDDANDLARLREREAEAGEPSPPERGNQSPSR